MMIIVVVVITHDPAVILGAKSVIDESQVVLDDHAASVLLYLFADDSFPESTTHLGRFVYNLASPRPLHLLIIPQIGLHKPYLTLGINFRCRCTARP